MAKQQKDYEIIELAKTLKGVPWSDEYEKMISGMLYDESCSMKDMGVHDGH